MKCGKNINRVYDAGMVNLTNCSIKTSELRENFYGIEGKNKKLFRENANI